MTYTTTFNIFFYIYLILSVPYECHPRHAAPNYICYLRYHCNHWVDTSTGKLIVPDDIIRQVVGAPELTWFISIIVIKKHPKGSLLPPPI
jgi:hypothetical protein